MKMKINTKKNIALLFVAMIITGLFACGEPTLQDKLYEELSAASEGKWECYEAIETDGNLSVKIEVGYVVNFKDGKKALGIVKKLAPNAKGMIEFTNAQTGMVLRKIPIE